MTYQEAYQKATGELKAAGIPEPESDAWILLEHVTGMTRTRYYVDGFERMPKNEEDRFFELVSCTVSVPSQFLSCAVTPVMVSSTGAIVTICSSFGVSSALT